MEQSLTRGAYQGTRLRVNSTSKNRGRLDIIADVINACRGGCTKSYVMLRANLNSATASDLIKKLLSCGLITLTEEEGSMIFFPTIRGIEFLRSYEQLLSFLETNVLRERSSGEIGIFQ
jgi:predicted transcriptional regulator